LVVGPKARLDDGTPAQAGGGSDGELEDQRSDEELEVGSKAKLEDAAVGASRRLSFEIGAGERSSRKKLEIGSLAPPMMEGRRKSVEDRRHRRESRTKRHRTLVECEAARFIAGASR